MRIKIRTPGKNETARQKAKRKANKTSVDFSGDAYSSLGLLILFLFNFIVMRFFLDFPTLVAFAFAGILTAVMKGIIRPFSTDYGL